MRKIAIGIILALCSLVLLSCGTSRQEEQSSAFQPSGTPAESSATAKPETDIDDSLNFYAQYQYGEDVASPWAAIKEAFMTAYTERMGPYIENLQLTELHFTPLQFDNTKYAGYFILTGTPAESLGWERADSYCRSFSLSTEDYENWTFAKSYSMKQGEYLAYAIYSEDYTSWKYAAPIVKGLSSAELYVSKLGESYTLTDKAALEALAHSLSLEWDGDFEYPGTRLSMDCKFVNPLYLSFADGSTKIVLTAGDGSNACYIWDFWYPYNTNRSIFEQFGVPLTAAGYERSGDITTTTNSFVYDSSEPDDGDKYTGSDVRVYDLDGRLLEHHEDWDSAMPSRGVVHNLVTLEYDGEGKLVKSDNYSDDVLYTTYIYEYDGQGLLTRRTTVFSDAISGVESGAGVIEEYKYDELGHVIEIKSYYPNDEGDEGGASTSYASFQYDDDGFRITDFN